MSTSPDLQACWMKMVQKKKRMYSRQFCALGLMMTLSDSRTCCRRNGTLLQPAQHAQRKKSVSIRKYIVFTRQEWNEFFKNRELRLFSVHFIILLYFVSFSFHFSLVQFCRFVRSLNNLERARFVNSHSVNKTVANKPFSRLQSFLYQEQDFVSRPTLQKQKFFSTLKTTDLYYFKTKTTNKT